MPKNKTVFEDCDVLVVGGGMAGTGATFEARHWGRNLKIIVLKKQTSIEVVQLLKDFMQLTVTWECSGEKINQRIM